MAEVIQKKQVDDLAFLEGHEVEATETIHFGFEDTMYVLDLGPDNAEQLRKTMEGYIRAARVVGGKGKAEQTKLASEQRRWAAQNGYSVNPRGRVPGEVQKAWREAHPQ
jgi:hypothetical protein